MPQGETKQSPASAERYIPVRERPRSQTHGRPYGDLAGKHPGLMKMETAQDIGREIGLSVRAKHDNARVFKAWSTSKPRRMSKGGR